MSCVRRCCCLVCQCCNFCSALSKISLDFLGIVTEGFDGSDGSCVGIGVVEQPLLSSSEAPASSSPVSFQGTEAAVGFIDFGL